MKKALTAALRSRFVLGKGVTDSLYSLVGGKMFDGEAPTGAKDPYVIYSVVSYTDSSTFSEEMYDVLLQFSIFSSSKGSTEIKDIEAALSDADLYKNQRFTFAGGTVIDMSFIQSDGPHLVTEETPDGGSKYWQTDVDFNLILNKG